MIHVPQFPSCYILYYYPLVHIIHPDIHMIISLSQCTSRFLCYEPHRNLSRPLCLISWWFYFYNKSYDTQAVTTGTLSTFIQTHCTYHIHSSNTGYLIILKHSSITPFTFIVNLRKLKHTFIGLSYYSHICPNICLIRSFHKRPSLMYYTVPKAW